MNKLYTIETELTDALFRLSNGKLSYEQAKEKAQKAAPNFDIVKYPMLAHKGVNWFAKQMLEEMGK